MDNELLNEFKSFKAGFDTRFEQLAKAVQDVQRQADAIDMKMREPLHRGGGDSRDGLKALADGIREHKDGFERHGRIRVRSAHAFCPSAKHDPFHRLDLRRTRIRHSRGRAAFPYRCGPSSGACRPSFRQSACCAPPRKRSSLPRKWKVTVTRNPR